MFQFNSLSDKSLFLSDLFFKKKVWFHFIGENEWLNVVDFNSLPQEPPEKKFFMDSRNVIWICDISEIQIWTRNLCDVFTESIKVKKFVADK